MSEPKHGKHAKVNTPSKASDDLFEEGTSASFDSTDSQGATTTEDEASSGDDDLLEVRGAHANVAANSDEDSDASSAMSEQDDPDEFPSEPIVDGSGAYAAADVFAPAPIDAVYANSAESTAVMSDVANGMNAAAPAAGASPTPHLSDIANLSAPTMAMPAVGADGSFDASAPLVVDGVELVKKRKNGKKIAAIVGGSIAAALVLVYLGGTAIFSNWFYPGTKIGAIDASLKSTQEVTEALDSVVSNYQVNISGDGFTASVDASNVGVKIDSEHIAQQMHYALPGWQWPLLITQSEHDLTGLFTAEYSSNEALNKDLIERVERFNETATLPVSANIAYDPTKKQFAVVPEVQGTAISPAAVISAVTDAILSLQTEVVLDETHLVQPAFISTDEILADAAVNASNMVSVDISLIMGGNPAGEINSDVIAPWVTLQSDGSVALDNGAMDAYINQLAEGLDTVGSERTYTRPDGKVITVAGGTYGWAIDKQALHDAVTGAILSGTSQTIEVACESQGETFTGPGQKDWGNRYIDIDLSEQHVRMYDWDGSLIWESDCISGAPDGEHDTNTGVYMLNSKATNAKLVGYDNYGNKLYESYVRYWMPFVGNAIGLHDADWQPGFGGYMYANGYGSHGCVNLPVSAAYNLFQITMVGDCVVSHW